MAPLLSALALGLLSAFGFAPYGLWPLTLLSFALLFLFLGRAGTWKQAAAIGWCFGFAQFVLGLDWIATAFTYQANMPAWLGWVAVALLSVYLALYPALATASAWWATKRIGGGAATLTLFLGASWALSEWLRGTMFTGFPWNPIAVSVVDLPLAHLARITGTYALSGLVVASAGFILILATRPREALARANVLSAANIPGAIGLGLLVGLYAVPAVLLRFDPPAPPPAGKGPTVHLVQPDIGQGERWAPELSARHLARLQALSGIPGTKPRLILWPESAIEDNVQEDPAARARLASILGPNDILLGGGEAPIRDSTGEEIAARNSIFAIGAGGRLIARYDKAHLVPYGEYLPMRPILSRIGVSRLVPGVLDFIPGPGPRSIDLPGFGTVGMQLCYEMVFSGHVVDEAHRPAFIFNPSNDAWFGPSGPVQHLAQARLRAIEEGIPIARATPNGVSALIDADGRLLKSLPAHAMGMVELPMPAALPPTIFARIGNWAVLLIALLLGGLAFGARRYKESFI
ncbi:apolipoprotein N-acyltransferase [Sphingomonas oligoaromativorans]|uniref:apolipoprotein N-acyltransferase n=1 Tax=Sphingomonas oligoaromativorans TaxID=575322 RepID=UPI00141EAB00|nr:apolipoprotein N-acyltransferase [Sphingomonas oligoaromativorans]NIJ34020.1 apolipoprotein N-acyltransferase [Sphingomonas oligoaromativorans]